MQIAEILSDLTSLRVCDPTAALALVSARPSSTSATQSSQAPQQPDAAAEEDDPDLTRAKDLVELHYKVKVAHVDGKVDKGLREAREAVRKAVEGPAYDPRIGG